MTQPSSQGMPAKSAEARAEAVIKAAHLEDIYALEPIPNRSTPNVSEGEPESWFYGPYVLRINVQVGEIAREAALLRFLPNGIPHATVIASSENWIVQKRLDGERLNLMWDDLGEAKQRAAAQQLAAILINLHQTRVSGMPSLSPGWYSAILPADIIALTKQLSDLDPDLMQEVARFTRRTRSAVAPPLRWGFVHRALSFDRVLWKDNRITALVEFENAIYAPRELELEALLREERPMLRQWLKEDYPLLFSEEGVDQRRQLYGIERDLRRLAKNRSDADVLAHLRATIAAQ